MDAGAANNKVAFTLLPFVIPLGNMGRISRYESIRMREEFLEVQQATHHAGIVP